MSREPSAPGARPPGPFLGQAGPAPTCRGDGAPGIGVILLAAGESTRMAWLKQLLDWHGMPLVQYQILELQATTVQEIVVVLGHRAEEIEPVAREVLERPRGHTVVNARYQQGKTTSVKAGLRALRGAVAGVMIIAVDSPRPRAVLQPLIDAHLAGRHRISVPAYRGRHGHPPLFDRSLIPELMAITEERQGVREVIERHRTELREVPIDSPLVVTNLNTPEDYRRAKELAGA